MLPAIYYALWNCHGEITLKITKVLLRKLSKGLFPLRVWNKIFFVSFIDFLASLGVRSIRDLTLRCEFKNAPLKSFFCEGEYMNPDYKNCNQYFNLMQFTKRKNTKLKQSKTFIKKYSEFC